MKLIKDIIKKEELAERYIDYPLARFAQKYKNSSVLFSPYGKTERFTTENIYLHFVKNEKSANLKNIDGINKIICPISSRSYNSLDIYDKISNRYSNFRNYISDLWDGSVQGVSAVKMWNLSIVSALIFGMFLMTFIYRYLGQNAKADSEKIVYTAPTEIVLGDSAEKEKIKTEDYVAQIIEDYQKETANEKSIKEDIKKMTKGYPIEKMAPFIAQQDKIVAAFLVGIAKKESDWGKHVPVLNGQDCFNYWGYRGIRKKMGTDGHTCFDSPEDAVKTVAKRLDFLVSSEKLNTPKEMVVAWKCGWDCSWDSKEAVRKWVSDVDHYFKKFNELEKL